MSYAPSLAYTYSGFTHPEFDGLGLEDALAAGALRALRDRGVRSLISTVHWRDRASLQSCAHLGYETIGSIMSARLFGRKDTGGRVEIMLERLLGDEEILAQLRVSKPPRKGGAICLEDGTTLKVVERGGAFFRLRLEGGGMARKLDERTVFAPARFVVSLADGEVRHRGRSFPLQERAEHSRAKFDG